MSRVPSAHPEAETSGCHHSLNVCWRSLHAGGKHRNGVSTDQNYEIAPPQQQLEEQRNN